MVFKDPKQIFVTYCLQLLLVLILYPVPETSNGKIPRNDFRHYLSKLHRPQDFQFLIDGMTRVLNQPVSAVLALQWHQDINKPEAPGNHDISSREPEVHHLGTGDDNVVLGSVAMQ